MKKTAALDKLKDAQEKIRAQQLQTPMQEIKPVKAKIDKANTYHLNAFIPKSLATDVKIKALREDKTLTDIVIEKLRSYLDE